MFTHIDVPTSGSDDRNSEVSVESFWNRKKEDLRQMKKEVNQSKRSLLSQPGRFQKRHLRPTQSFRQKPGRRNLSTIYEPKVIDNTNYKNYLRKRFPHITKENKRPEDDDSSIDSPTNDLSETLSEYAPVVKPRQRVIHVIKPENTLEAYIYFCENKLFSQDFVDAFINQHLDEEAIPDLLIEIFSNPPTIRTTTMPRRNFNRRPSRNEPRNGHRNKYFKSELMALPGVGEKFSSRPSSLGIGTPGDYFDNDREDRFRSFSDMDFTRKDFVDPKFNPLEAQSVDMMQLLLREELPDIFEEIVRDAVTEESEKIMNKLDVADILAPYLTDEVIGELMQEICRSTIKDLAFDEMLKGYQFDILQDLIDELLEELGPSIARKAVGEDFLESVLDEIVEPVVDQEALQLAKEVLTVYDNRLRRRDLKEIQRTAVSKPLESLLMSYLVNTLTSSDTFLVSSRSQHHFLEGTALDILLKQHRRIQDSRNLTLTCPPLREIHREIFTEDALGVITDELMQQIDADLCDLDFDEVRDPDIKRYILNVDEVYNNSQEEANV